MDQKRRNRRTTTTNKSNSSSVHFMDDNDNPSQRSAWKSSSTSPLYTNSIAPPTYISRQSSAKLLLPLRDNENENEYEDNTDNDEDEDGNGGRRVLSSSLSPKRSTISSCSGNSSEGSLIHTTTETQKLAWNSISKSIAQNESQTMVWKSNSKSNSNSKFKAEQQQQQQQQQQQPPNLVERMKQFQFIEAVTAAAAVTEMEDSVHSLGSSSCCGGGGDGGGDGGGGGGTEEGQQQREQPRFYRSVSPPPTSPQLLLSASSPALSLLRSNRNSLQNEPLSSIIKIGSSNMDNSTNSPTKTGSSGMRTVEKEESKKIHHRSAWNATEVPCHTSSTSNNKSSTHFYRTTTAADVPIMEAPQRQATLSATDFQE